MAELWYDDAATWRKAKEFYYNDAGTWRKAKECWYNDGGTWRQVFSGFTLANGLVFDAYAIGTIAPSTRFNADGTVDSIGPTSTYTANGSWGSPTTAGIGSSYWIFMTLGSTSNGSTMTGSATGTWLQLSSAPDWGIQAAPSAGSVRDRRLSYVIAVTSGGATLASGSLTLTSDRT
jgi:hypothetical protein